MYTQIHCRSHHWYLWYIVLAFQMLPLYILTLNRTLFTKIQDYCSVTCIIQITNPNIFYFFVCCGHKPAISISRNRFCVWKVRTQIPCTGPISVTMISGVVFLWGEARNFQHGKWKAAINKSDSVVFQKTMCRKSCLTGNSDLFKMLQQDSRAPA